MTSVYCRPSDPVHRERLLTIHMDALVHSPMLDRIRHSVLVDIKSQDGMTKYTLSSTACIILVNNVLDKSFPIKG